MKKRIWLAWILALFLVGCGNSAPAETAAPTEAPTEAETEPTVSVSERLEEIRPLYYGTPDAMPDRKAAVAMLEELADEDEPEVNYLLALGAYLQGDYAAAKARCETAIAGEYDLARVLLGEMYLSGTVATPRDVEKAEALFRQAIDNGCADGHVGIGDIHQSGHKGKKDNLKAIDEFSAAAKDGTDPYWRGYAIGSMGSIHLEKYAEFTDYRDYDIYIENYEAALEELEKGAELWNDWAFNLLSVIYNDGLGVEADPEMAEQYAKKQIELAEKTGSTGAIESAAALYDSGRGVEQDYEKALEWYRKGAELGSGYCMNLIGMYYYYGHSVEADPAQEFEWYRKAAEAEYKNGMYNLGISYLLGDCVEQDEEKALEWLEKAAEYGYSGAMTELGNYYRNNKDYEKAEEWYLKGVDLQNTNCMLNLGVMHNYYNRDTEKEARYTEMASYLGNAWATRRIAESFEKQIFYFRDWNRAVEFYKQAVDEGCEEALNDLQRLGVAYNP